MGYLFRKLSQWLDKAISAVERQTADRPMSKEMAERLRKHAREWEDARSKDVPADQEHGDQEA